MLTAFVIFAGLQALGQRRQLGRQLSTKMTVTSWLPRWEARSLPQRRFLRPEDEPLQATCQGAVILHTAFETCAQCLACLLSTHVQHARCLRLLRGTSAQAFIFICLQVKETIDHETGDMSDSNDAELQESDAMSGEAGANWNLAVLGTNTAQLTAGKHPMQSL